MDEKLYIAILEAEVDINKYEKFSNGLIQEAYIMGARHFKELLIANLNKYVTKNKYSKRTMS